MEDRKAKYMMKQPTQVPEEYKIMLNMDITELDLLCGYVLSDNNSINRGHLLTIRHLIQYMDMRAFNGKLECQQRMELIMRALDARLDQNVRGRDLVLRTVAGGMGANNIPQIHEPTIAEIEWIQTSVESILKYAHLQAEAPVGLELLTKLMSSDYASRGTISEELEIWINRVQGKIRRSKIESAEEMTFSLQPSKLVESLRMTHAQVTSRHNTLRFGTQALNLITGGGLQAKRVYILLGLPAEGKSATLLDMAIQIKKYNRDYKCEDPLKRPCVLLLTMENDTAESVERLYNMTTHQKLKDIISDEEAIQIFQQTGLSVSDDDPIDIIIKYRPGLSESTDYIYKAIDDLADDGYETICVVMDYLKRIHSAQGTFNGDFRRELGECVNELKTLAICKRIPVVTASQMNRDATKNMDGARARNSADLVRVMGRSNISESNLILENADWIAQIAPEYDRATGAKFLGMQCIKHRYFIDDRFLCFYMPYIGDTIKLMEDANMPNPVHRITMKSEDELRIIAGMSPNIMGSAKVGNMSNRPETQPPADPNGFNIFNNASGFAAFIPQVAKPKVQLYHLVDNTKPYRKRLYHLVNNIEHP